MSERHTQGQRTGQGPEGFDRELDVRRILQFGVGLALVIVVVLIGIWFLSVFLKSQEQAADPPPSPIAAANQRRLPPEPRLQVSPPRDMNEFREQEDRIVTSYGWVDERAGIARIPIDRAIEVVLEKGLPVPPPLPSPAPAQGAPGNAPAGGGMHAPAAGPQAGASGIVMPAAPPADTKTRRKK